MTHSVALNSLHFYCGLETIKYAIRLGQVLNEVVSEAIKEKMPSAFIGEEIKLIDFQISNFEKMNSGIQQEILALLQSDNHSPLLISHREQLAENFKKIAELHSSKVELVKRKYLFTENCRDVIKKNLRPIHESCRDVLLLARRELSFPIDEAVYKNIMTASIDAAVQHLDELFSEIRKQVEEKMN